MKDALRKNKWDIIIADYKMPNFSGIKAFDILKGSGLDIPFILVSGTIGEQVAVEAMRKGLNDYIMKDNLSRLVPAIEREIKECKIRENERMALSQLKESNEKFKIYFEKNPAYSYIMSPEGLFIDVNESALNALGYEKKELIGKHRSMIYPPESIPRMNEIFTKLEKIGNIKNEEITLITKSGEKRFVLVSTEKIADKNGNWINSISIHNDITERKKAEDALKENEEKFRSLIEQSIEGIVITDENGRIIEWNKAQEEITNMGKKEALGKYLWDVQFDFMLPERKTNDAYQRMKNQLLNFLSTQDAPWINKFLETKIMPQDGKIKTIQTIAFPVHTKKGLSVVGISLDITEKKRAEEALKKSEEKYKELVENANSIIAKFDKDGTILSMNEYGLKFFGYEEKEIIGKKWHETCLPHIESSGKILENLIQNIYQNLDKYATNINENIKKNGERAWVYWANKPILDEEGNIVSLLSVGTDITERKKMEEELEKRENTLKGIFAAAPVGINLIHDRKIVWCNSRMQEITGYPLDEVIENDTRFLYEDEDEYNNLNSLYTHDITDYPQETPTIWKRKDGRIINVSIRVSPYNPFGVSQGFITSVSDVTKEKKTEQALKEREETLDGILSSAPIGINLMQNRIFRWTNRGMAEITGYPVEEIVGKSPRFLFESDGEYERVGGLLYSLPREKEVIEVETKYIIKSGDIRDIYIRNSPLDNNDLSKGYITLVMDITNPKKAKKQLDDNLEYFAHLVDHIRNPLAILSGFAQLEVENEKTRDRFLRQIDRVEEIIKQLDQGWMDTEDTRKFMKKYM